MAAEDGPLPGEPVGGTEGVSEHRAAWLDRVPVRAWVGFWVLAAVCLLAWVLGVPAR